MTLPDLCTRRPVLATVMSILIVVLGIAALTRMPVRELPNTSTAQVTVSVGYTGAGPGVVDSELASVIEGAISTVAGIDRVSTESELGGLRTVITVQQGRDVDQAASDVRAAVQAVTQPLSAPLASAMIRPAAACSSSSTKKCCMASEAALAISGRTMAPPR